MQVVVKCTPFTQELRRENQVSHLSSLRNRSVNPTGIVDLINHHHRSGVDDHNILDHGFDHAGIEIVGFWIVIDGSGDNDKVSPLIHIGIIQRGSQI